MIKFLDLNNQYQGIKEEIDQAIQAIINSSAFIGGESVSSFEEEFAKYQDAQYCVGVGNGTDALEIAIEALDIPKGSEIIVPANSFVATSEAVTRSGCNVVFCDCDPDNYTISIDSLKKLITKSTGAVIPVHLYGHSCDMDEILMLSREYKFKVIEDCAQAHGAEYKGVRVGSIGDIAAFSFYPGKNLGAFGDGGAIVTNDKDLALLCKMIGNHGRKDKYDHKFEGRNSRLDGIQAAVLSVKLKHLDMWIDKRRHFAEMYRKLLKGVGDLFLPIEEVWSKHAYHLFVIRTNEREALRNYLKSKGVLTGVHYPIALPRLDAYQKHHQHMDQMNAVSFSDKLLSLPMGEHLTDNDVRAVSELIKNFFQQ